MEVFTLSRRKNFDRSNSIRKYNSNYPQKVYGVGNLETEYYRNLLYNIVYSIFEFDNFPSHWNKQYFKDILYTKGYIPVVEYKGEGWALSGGLGGINIFNKPSEVFIANPIIGNFKRTIGKDAEIIYKINLTVLSLSLIIIGKYSHKLMLA